jgi:hypothetical protein
MPIAPLLRPTFVLDKHGNVHPKFMVLMAVIALVAFVTHGHWIDGHPWHGSRPQALDDQMQRIASEHQ